MKWLDDLENRVQCGAVLGFIHDKQSAVRLTDLFHACAATARTSASAVCVIQLPPDTWQEVGMCATPMTSEGTTGLGCACHWWQCQCVCVCMHC